MRSVMLQINEYDDDEQACSFVYGAGITETPQQAPGIALVRIFAVEVHSSA